MELPARLLRNLRDVHPEAGAWLRRLPEHLRACERAWRIRVTGLVPDLSYHVAWLAEGADGARCVLKLSPPADEFGLEIAALGAYRGDGICRLVQADEARAAMLLERLEPGVSLWGTDPADPAADEAATRSAAALMRRLWRTVPEPHPFRTLSSWSRALPAALARPDTPLPRELLRRADALRLELLQNPERLLLHADLHHGNILSATRQPLLAIDPKGIVGPRGYEVGPFLMNPTPGLAQQPGLRAILERRAAIFAEALELPRGEVVAWGLVHAALSACWSAEDHGAGWGAALAVAERLAAL